MAYPATLQFEAVAGERRLRHVRLGKWDQGRTCRNLLTWLGLAADRLSSARIARKGCVNGLAIRTGIYRE